MMRRFFFFFSFFLFLFFPFRGFPAMSFRRCLRNRRVDPKYTRYSPTTRSILPGYLFPFSFLDLPQNVGEERRSTEPLFFKISA
ncbi:hypothetical protein F4809DRAFT_450682 [Biscogniauxia mediterranea]|nr:hypothetical protein F4809DRAFT_450682 [Biscogniauxia mediterranea]